MIAQDPMRSAATEPDGELASRIGTQLSAIVEHASRFAELRAERARRAFAGKLAGMALASIAGLVLAIFALRGAWLVADGLALSLGPLAGGALLLALVLGGAALGFALANSAKRRAELERREQAELEALKDSATELGEELLGAAKVRERVRAHPWLALAAGFATGIAAAPLAGALLGKLAPLARGALSLLPGLPPSLQRAFAPNRPTQKAG